MYSKQVQEYWETTSLENRDYRLFHRHKAVNLFMKKLFLSYGDAIRFCYDITDGNKTLTVDNFTKSTMVEFEKIRTDDNISTRWNRCLSFVLSKFHVIERFESLHIRRYIEQYNKTGEIDSLLLDVDEETATEIRNYVNQIVSPFYPFYKVYNKLYYTFEYKLSWRLCQFLSKKHMIEMSAKQELTTLAEAVCLYTALHNEQEKLYNEAAIYDVALPDLSEEELTCIQEEPQKDIETAPQTIAPKPQAMEVESAHVTKQEEEDNTTLAEKKADKEWIQKVFTARANKYFAKAIDVGYMQETETGYQWTYSNEFQPIVYFFMRIYDKGKPPYKKLQALFRIPSQLRNVATELRWADWYEDALERDKLIAQGKDPEKDAPHKLKDPTEWYIELKKFFDEQ